MLKSQERSLQRPGTMDNDERSGTLKESLINIAKNGYVKDKIFAEALLELYSKLENGESKK